MVCTMCTIVRTETAGENQRIAGNRSQGDADSTGSAYFAHLGGIVLDHCDGGVIYVLDTFNSNIRKVTGTNDS
jgi:hypothetical protein